MDGKLQVSDLQASVETVTQKYRWGKLHWVLKPSYLIPFRRVETMLIQSNLKKSAQIALLLALSSVICARDLRTELSKDEFVAAGLSKLSASELSELERLLERGPTMKAHAPSANTSAGNPALAPVAVSESSPDWVAPREPTNADTVREIIETTFTDSFRGFNGNTEITLSNGQVWKQTDRSVSGAPPRDNRVRIKPAVMGRWLLQFRATNKSFPVKRIK